MHFGTRTNYINNYNTQGELKMNGVIEFLKDNKDAFTAIGILLTFFISLISLRFTVKNNKAVHYVNSVTKNRVEWIDKLRKNMAEFISLLDTQDLTDTFIEIDEFIKIPIGKNLKNLNQIGSEIKLMMNYSDRFDREIMDQIDLIIVCYKKLHLKIQQTIMDNKKNHDVIFIPDDEVLKSQEEINVLSARLLSDMQVYLKSEWNRVKYESKGKTYEKETQLFDLDELIQKKADPNYKNDTWKRFCINSKAMFKRILHSHQLSIIIFIIALIILILSLPSIVKDISRLFTR